MSTNLRANISDYANRVLGVIKEKYGLRDKSEALDKFADMFGEPFVEKEMKDSAMKELIKTCNNHIKKHGRKKMSINEFDKLCGM